MLMYIPKVGDEIIISKNIEVSIQNEYRNEKLLKLLNLHDFLNMFILKENTHLKIERVFVRAGDSSDFDSVTFKILKSDNSDLVGSRFWLNLDDVNRIEFELFSTKNKAKNCQSYSYLSQYVKFKHKAYGFNLFSLIISEFDLKPIHTFEVFIPRNVVENIEKNNKVSQYCSILNNDNNSFNYIIELYQFSDEYIILFTPNFKHRLGVYNDTHQTFCDLKSFQKSIKGNDLPYSIPIKAADKNIKSLISYKKDDNQITEKEFFKFFKDLSID